MFNRVIQGDCATVLKTLPGESVDFVPTDPPYFVRYKDRSGRTIRNDLYPGKVLDAFNDVYRVLKPNSLCVSFYGWNRVDSFFSAWPVYRATSRSRGVSRIGRRGARKAGLVQGGISGGVARG